MSDEMRGEDTILGTALARAIDSQPIRSTPFERSRVAVRMAGGGRSPLFPVLAAAAAVVLGLALGTALLGQRGGDPGGVAASPTPSPDASASPGGSPAASPTATPQGNDRIWVYFALDQLPPVGAYVRGSFDDSSAERRIASRLGALADAAAPSGLFNAFATLRTEPTVDEVRIEGDLVTVDYAVPNGDWGIGGSAATLALVQQLVYTASEEPGIRRVLITQNGGQTALIDQAEISAPLAREEVLPYEGVKTEERIALEDDPRPSTATTRIEDLAGGIRFVIELKANETPEGGFWSPRVSAQLEPNEGNCPGKSRLVIELPGANDPAAPAGSCLDGGSPLRGLGLSRGIGPTPVMRYELFLDDARPWRVSLEPGAERGTMRLIVDVGGHPQAISDSVAVYGPKPGDQVSRTFTLTGTARAFEAHVAWRIKDANQREVATGFATASLGTSPVWGTFTTEVKIPDNVSGVVTLEVFWPSPRDGADVGTVAIPLRVR